MRVVGWWGGALARGRGWLWTAGCGVLRLSAVDGQALLLPICRGSLLPRLTPGT